ncbi:hypothetical protein M3629_03670 [Paenibacillus polysaccharolyticus]|uniref:hypothetical protein n=1 Tax=Paenibacillus polysaccharolyticus TaxID=582692 RepID=UPI00203A9514|nr:hypothetical protein [Paenibacillus polysaccharolyticus]MCM3131866.1 hypothetical protein [Paenibacillus polysaccharolyticus]
MRPKKMTDHYLTYQLADLMGYEFHESETVPPLFLTRQADGSLDFFIPCSEYNHVNPIQDKALETDQISYLAHLIYATGHSYSEGLTYDTAESMLRATPRQRAEAAYMTLKEALGHE